MAKKLIPLTNYETGKEINLAPDIDIVRVEEIGKTNNFAERTVIQTRDGAVYLVKESAKAVCKQFGL